MLFGSFALPGKPVIRAKGRHCFFDPPLRRQCREVCVECRFCPAADRRVCQSRGTGIIRCLRPLHTIGRTCRTAGESPITSSGTTLTVRFIRVNDPRATPSNSRTQPVATRTIFPSQERNHFSIGFPGIAESVSSPAGSAGRAITMPPCSNSRNRPVNGNRPFARTTLRRNVREFPAVLSPRFPENPARTAPAPAAAPNRTPDRRTPGGRAAVTTTGPDRMIGSVTSTSRSNSPHRTHLKTDRSTRSETSVAECARIRSPDPRNTSRHTTVRAAQTVATWTFPSTGTPIARGSPRRSAPAPASEFTRRPDTAPSTAIRARGNSPAQHPIRLDAAVDRAAPERSGRRVWFAVGATAFSLAIRLLQRLGSPSATKGQFRSAYSPSHQ